MCNRIYLFIFLLLDAKLLTEHPPHKHPQLREVGEKERVLCVCVTGAGKGAGVCLERARSGHAHRQEEKAAIKPEILSLG